MFSCLENQDIPISKFIRKIVTGIGVLFFTIVFQFPQLLMNHAYASQVSMGNQNFNMDYRVYSNRKELKENVQFVKSKLSEEKEKQRQEMEQRIDEQRKLARVNQPYTRFSGRGSDLVSAGGTIQTGSFTAYNSDPRQCDGDPFTTASGKKTAWGVLAGPPGIPFGTKIRIEGFSDDPEGKIFVVWDRGGAIKGNRFDIWFPSYSDAIAFGRQTLQYEILPE